MKDFTLSRDPTDQEIKAFEAWLKAIYAEQYGTKKQPDGIEYNYEFRLPQRVYTPAENKLPESLQDEAVADEINKQLEEMNEQKERQYREMLNALRE